MRETRLKIPALLAGTIGATLLANVALAEGGISEAQLLASMCNTCHGTDGKGAGGAPELAGVEAVDNIDVMKGYQSGEEETTIMKRHADGYTDEQIKAVADYFADL